MPVKPQLESAGRDRRVNVADASYGHTGLVPPWCPKAYRAGPPARAAPAGNLPVISWRG
jgi:hypothetical protein